MRSCRFWHSLITLIAVVALSAPSLPAAQPKSFSEATTVVAVEVPIQVLVNGNPVRGLTAADFEILDGRRAQEITGFEVVDLAQGRTQAAAPAPAPPSGRRHFLLLFDLSFSRPASIVKARHAARRLVLDTLHPSDLVAVATYTVNRGPALLLGFTSDREQVELAIETMGLPQLIERYSDPLALALGDKRAEARTDQISKADEVVLEELKLDAQSEATAARQFQGNRVIALTRSFTDLAKLMDNVKGRKHVVYLSEGFDSQLISGTADEAARSEMNQAAESGELWKIDSEARFGSTRLQNDLEGMLDAFRRSDCAIQAVDIGGLEGTSGLVARRAQRDSLLTMAKDTGGQLFENFNDLGEAMAQMLESTSVTYVLTFQPQSLKLDGEYHKIKVRLKGGPEGARLVHRPGYYAPLPFEQRKGLARQLEAADLLLGGQPGGELGVGGVAATFPSESGLAYVPVVVEVDGRGLLAGLGSGGVLGVELYAYAFNASGGVQDFVAQNLQLDLAKVREKLASEGMKLFGGLYLPPGSYSLRVLARNSTTGAYGLEEIPLSVPSFEAATPVVLPPLFTAPMTQGLVARATGAQRRPDPPYPFLLGEEFFLPQGRPGVAVRGEAKICQMTFHFGGGPLQVRGEVLAADGQLVPGPEVELLERRATGSAGLERLSLAFRPQGLMPGSYTLRLTMINPDTGRSATSWTPFSVRGGA